MTVEAIGSIGFGLMAGNLALLAFGGDSVVEFISGLVTLGRLRKDATEPQIHKGRSELATSLLLFALIPVIGLGAIYSYATGIRSEGTPLGLAVTVGSIIVMPYLWLQKKRIGYETRSLVLSTDAIESVTCFLMSVTVLGGLLTEHFFGLWWADYLATAVILAFVLKEAVESYRGMREN
jgi:divalent metal cation (Fe/Co/Zn/Cd) transporter